MVSQAARSVVDRQGVEAPRGAPPAGDPLAASPSDAWLGDDVVLTSVGVDIGSATTHVTFSRLRLRRKATQLSTAYALVERTGTAAIILFGIFAPDLFVNIYLFRNFDFIEARMTQVLSLHINFNISATLNQNL